MVVQSAYGWYGSGSEREFIGLRYEVVRIERKVLAFESVAVFGLYGTGGR